MKQPNILLLFVLLAPLSIFAQISRNQWLAGGSFAGHYQKNSTDDNTIKEIRVPLNIGYFVANKLAVGLRGQYSNSVMTQSYSGMSYYYFAPVKQTETVYAVGPFIRYYILPQTSRFNLYAETYYSYGSGKLTLSSRAYSRDIVSKTNVNIYNINLAPVFIINQHTSIELIAGYYLQKTENRTTSYHNFVTGLGLQIHLGNGKSPVNTN